MFIKIKSITYLFALCISVNVSAAILNKGEVEQAGLSLLQDETQIFQSIGMGIALSLAQCDGIDLCTLTVEESEIQSLIKTLDTRIESLILRQEQAEDPEGFDKVLTAYINERESYNSHLEKLKSISSTLDAESNLLDELEAESDFPVDAARDAELLDYVEDELSLFGDDELEDDEDLEDLSDLPELDEPDTTP